MGFSLRDIGGGVVDGVKGGTKLAGNVAGAVKDKAGDVAGGAANIAHDTANITGRAVVNTTNAVLDYDLTSPFVAAGDAAARGWDLGSDLAVKAVKANINNARNVALVTAGAGALLAETGVNVGRAAVNGVANAGTAAVTGVAEAGASTASYVDNQQKGWRRLLARFISPDA
jgi:hypothetical protein